MRRARSLKEGERLLVDPFIRAKPATETQFLFQPAKGAVVHNQITSQDRHGQRPRLRSSPVRAIVGPQRSEDRLRP